MTVWAAFSYGHGGNAAVALHVLAGVIAYNYTTAKDREDHAVVLVGWGTQKDNGVSRPYWIIKNSWSSQW